MKTINKLFFIIVFLLFLGNTILGQKTMKINNPKNGSTERSYLGNATETEIPVKFNGHSENWDVPYGDWWTVLEDHKGNKYDSRDISLNELEILTAPGTYKWIWRMYEKNVSGDVKDTDTDFTVKHSIEVVNIFDLNYGGSKILIDDYLTTSGQYAYKGIDDILKVGAVNQEYNGTIYVWRSITGLKSQWDRRRKDINLYKFRSNDKNYDYTVVANDNGARLRGALQVHTLLAAPSNFSVSTPFGQSPVLSWSSTTNLERSGFRVYKKYTTSSGTVTLNSFTTSNTYTDTNFESNPIFGEDEVEYWVIAEDIYGFTSNETEHITVEGTSFYQWKIANEQEQTNEIKTFDLFDNYPNPFNPATQISYQLPRNSFVNLVVYNALGQEVTQLVNQYQSSGQYSVQFNASTSSATAGNLPSGVYIYKLVADSYRQVGTSTGSAAEFSSVKKMLLVK